MKQNKSNLSRRFEHYAPKAPEGLLRDVKAEMERRQLSMGRPKLRENYLAVRRVAVLAAAAAVALTVVMVWRGSDKATVSSLTADGGTKTTEQTADKATAAEKATAADFRQLAADAISRAKAVLGRSSVGDAATDGLLAEAAPSAVAESAAVESATVSPSSAEPRPVEKQEQPSAKHPATRHDDAYYNNVGSSVGGFGRSDRASRLSVSAYYGGGGNGMRQNSQGMMMAAAGTYGENSDFLNYQDAKVSVGSPSRIASDMKHHRPIRAGVSVRWQLSQRWGIGSGISYSYLKSDYNSQDARGETTGEQHLHYVGIPLSVDYSIWQNRHARVYVTGGGEAQKLVDGHSNVRSTDGSESRYDVKEKRMQWSVNVAAGGEYRFTPNLGVYVEPGVDHHFKNGSSVDNYYKHKSTSFSLNMGLRWNIE